MRNKYEYRLELDARSKAGAWGDQVRIKGYLTAAQGMNKS